MTVDPPVEPRVLVVDDEQALLNAHARVLSKADYRVETATDGLAAERLLDQAPFDVILSDIDMPGMNGIALLERVRQRDLDVPVVFITGNPSVETAIKAMEHGAHRYLVKPVHSELLIRIWDDAVRLAVDAKPRQDMTAIARDLATLREPWVVKQEPS